MPLKICENCFQEFEDEEVATVSSVAVLGEIFIKAVGGNNFGTWDARSLCPACKEKLGIANLLGFGS